MVLLKQKTSATSSTATSTVEWTNMRKLLTLAVILLFLAGCTNVSITYHHKLNADGSSTLEQQVDLSNYIRSTAGDKLDPSQLALLCASIQPQLKEGTECKVEGNIWTLKKSFKTEDGFYTFEAKDNKYKLTLSKLPEDLYIKRDVDTGSDLGEEFSGGIGFDFNNKEENKQSAEQIKRGIAAGLPVNLTYVVEMPGTITKAGAAGYNAKIEGSKATFDMVKIFEDSAPLVIESDASGGNLLLIAGAAVLVIVILAILWFFLKSKK